MIENLSASARSLGEAELGVEDRANATLVVRNLRAMETALAAADNPTPDNILDMQRAVINAEAVETKLGLDHRRKKRALDALEEASTIVGVNKFTLPDESVVCRSASSLVLRWFGRPSSSVQEAMLGCGLWINPRVALSALEGNLMTAERGNTKHSPHLDEKMKQETRGMVKGNQPARAEEGRETEPFPDETDPAQVRNALGIGEGDIDDADSGPGGEEDQGTGETPLP
ncbi:hypothetical protein AB4Z38_11940 [Arthrobacter sp. 2RAF6]|uniref:hypothetical protein n=1 Tax=Arthrobacter sp. 2RAF6 TaxID=3233002 RepID=UPI003F9321CD